MTDRTRSRVGPCEVCGWSILGPPFVHRHCADPAGAARYLTPAGWPPPGAVTVEDFAPGDPHYALAARQWKWVGCTCDPLRWLIEDPDVGPLVARVCHHPACPAADHETDLVDPGGGSPVFPGAAVIPLRPTTTTDSPRRDR